MKNLSYLISTLIISVCSTQAFATVGGEQSIEFLGYEAKEQKVYLLRYYGDESGRLPQLYYYQLNQTQAPKLISVNSIYTDPKTKKVEKYLENPYFEQQLKKIKSRLKPLKAANAATAKIQILSTAKKQVPHPQNNEWKITQYTYKYNISSKNMLSQTQTAVAYKPYLKISQYYTVPAHNMAVAAVKYLAFPEETGYTSEDPVLLITK